MRRFVAMALAVLLCCGLTAPLSGCGKLLQPSRGELARASSFIDRKALKIGIYTIVTNDVVTIHHDTTVSICGTDAIWSGIAKAHYRGSEFVQECNTVCAEGKALKSWRGKWVETTVHSPVSEIMQWLQMVKQGAGYYDKTPVTAAELPSQFSGIDGKLYCITLAGQCIDWTAFTDMNPDTFFGGEGVLKRHETVHVNLYFGAEDFRLKAIILSAGEMADLVNVYITISQAESAPDIDLSRLEVVTGTLSEEWDLVTKYKNDTGKPQQEHPGVFLK